MKLKYIFFTLVTLLLLSACEKEKYSPVDDHTVTGFAELFATIGEAEEVQTRAEETDYKTYTAFSVGDQIGLYATESLREYDYNYSGIPGNELPQVKNLKFQLYNTSTSTRWGDNTGEPILKWDTEVLGKEPADIYAYFPYQGDYNNQEDNGNYSIFSPNPSGDKDQLVDVLVAQRTTVENNNPAIFLTFKHRFSLLHLSLGTGMAAVTESDKIFAITTEGIAENATIQLKDYVVRLEQGDINNFKAIKSGTDYYIILPAGTIANATDSLQVDYIKIGDDNPSKLAVPITMQPSMIYHMTMHKHEGSITFEENGIEVWGGNHDLGGIREEPGIYWASDLSNLIKQYNANPGEKNLSLEAYGTWDKEKGYWVFDLRRHIDMNDINWEDQSFNSFYGIFNGNGYSITGLDITTGNGLFDVVESYSEINDLTLVNISVNSEGNAGALAGAVGSYSTIHNCHVTGTSVVNGSGSTGGLIGISDGVITRCSSAAEVNATGGGVGGLVGYFSGKLEDSYATGRVTAEGSDVGGLVGSAGSPIKNCYAACSVTGINNVGGLAGSANADVENCYAVGDIIGVENVGGLIGEASGNVRYSSSGGSATGEAITGGLIGVLSSNDSEVSYSYSRSAVFSTSGSVGGLIGWAPKAEINTIITYPEPEDPDPVDPEDPEEPIDPKDPENPENPEDPEDPEDPDPDPEPIITIEYESGPKITYCYTTNGLLLLGSGGWIEYSYDTGKVTVVAEMGSYYYSIDLSSLNEEGEAVKTLLKELNNGEDKSAWVIGIVIINGKKYSLPILTSNK